MTRLANMHTSTSAACSAAIAILLAVLSFTATAQQVFDSPEAAVDALVAAAKTGDDAALVQLFGPKSRDIVGTVDKARDRELRSQFAAAAGDYRRIDTNADGSLTLVVGYQWWPLPIPLIKSGAAWRFDIDAGATEIVNRRIGANEFEAIAMLHGFVDAQRAYAAQSRDGSGVRGFARKLVSSAGKKDGLYWPQAAKGDGPSPFATSIGEPGAGDAPMLRNGYRYRILTAQGASAPGGAYSYVINGRLLAGFALIAYPAEYGKTGVMTFIVNHYGDVYEKNLGPRTAETASKITTYAPDASWHRAED
jgi:hypothetical protein